MKPSYRRSPRLVAYWRGERFVLHPYRHGPSVTVSPALVQLLDAFSDWTPREWYQKALGLDARAAGRQLNRLVEVGILERSDASPAKTVGSAWDTWDIAASFLHFSTSDRTFLPYARVKAQLADRSRQQAPPPSLKAYTGHPRVALPQTARQSAFHDVLSARRTWRRFDTRPIALADLSAVLQTTFGVQRWADLGSLGRVMLRTSPSGGSRHPIEAYVLARQVRGLQSGVYHYAPAEHALVEIRRRRFASRTFARLTAGQPWYGGAAALVIFSAVLARKAWAYRSARAYRSLLLEAGHFCQTLCLAATERGLAPFCTGAFSESLIEETLGLDPETEPVVYVAGVGSRPPRVRWAPLPRGEFGLGD